VSVTVITAMFGDHDEPPHAPVAQGVDDVRWVYYTDSADEAPPPWETHRVEGRYASANLSAKVYKCCPPMGGDVIWIDANMAITSQRFVVEALHSRIDGIAAWRHPRRDCIYDEAVASVEGREAQNGKYSGFDLAGQVASYRADGYPAHNGLYACGTIAYDQDRVDVRRFGTAWFDECVRWSPQDQLSFPVVAWRLGVKPGVFPYAQVMPMRRRERWVVRNQWMTLHDHIGR
jgi:hypothetical protein